MLEVFQTTRASRADLTVQFQQSKLLQQVAVLQVVVMATQSPPVFICVHITWTIFMDSRSSAVAECLRTEGQEKNLHQPFREDTLVQGGGSSGLAWLPWSSGFSEFSSFIPQQPEHCPGNKQQQLLDNRIQSRCSSGLLLSSPPELSS